MGGVTKKIGKSLHVADLSAKGIFDLTVNEVFLTRADLDFRKNSWDLIFSTELSFAFEKYFIEHGIPCEPSVNSLFGHKITTSETLTDLEFMFQERKAGENAN